MVFQGNSRACDRIDDFSTLNEEDRNVIQAEYSIGGRNWSPSSCPEFDRCVCLDDVSFQSFIVLICSHGKIFRFVLRVRQIVNCAKIAQKLNEKAGFHSLFRIYLYFRNSFQPSKKYYMSNVTAKISKTLSVFIIYKVWDLRVNLPKFLTKSLYKISITSTAFGLNLLHLLNSSHILYSWPWTVKMWAKVQVCWHSQWAASSPFFPRSPSLRAGN